jgi:hypothetical protein
VSGETHVVTQGAAACAVTGLAPATASFAASGGVGSVTVSTNGSECGWSAVSSASWLTITSGESGTGTSGTIEYAVEANPIASSRTATITVDGRIHVVSQSTAAGVDFDGFFGEVSALTVDGVPYSVIDVYAQFAEPSVMVVNAYNSSVSNVGGTPFHHSDVNTITGLPGTWTPSASIAVGGADPMLDSFVTIGGMPGSANTTALDPNFTPATAPIPPTSSGWFNSNPPNFQGLTDPASRRTWLGRFVIVAPATGDSLSFTASITYAEFEGGSTGQTQQSTSTLTIAYP